MKHKGLKVLFLMLFAAMAMPIMAQNTAKEPTKEPAKEAVTEGPTKEKEPKQNRIGKKFETNDKKVKVSTEFGLGVGARYNWFSVVPISQNFTPKMTMNWSGGAALQFRLNIGRSFGFQPEISYARSVLRIDDKATNNFTTKVKSNIVQIPMLLSFRAAMFRFNFGPVFTLMDEATYQLPRIDDESIQQMHIGKIYPTITYTAGISVRFAKVMMIDVRYADQFKDIKAENQYIWTLDQAKQPEAMKFRTRTRSVQLRVGVVF